MDEELDEELGYSKYDYRNKETDNSRNGHSSKTMHTSYGDMDVAIPRDRNGDYEPQLIKKYQNTVTQDMEEKILSMYAKGMTTGDIESHMRELYDIDISDSTISRITDKILPIVKEWQERPLEEVYAVVFMDAIHYHVRSEGRIVKRAVYIALGIDMNGKKDVLGMYVGENESAKFWLSIMNGLKNRGVEDILIACVDGLNGFPQAIEAVYPNPTIVNVICVVMECCFFLFFAIYLPPYHILLRCINVQLIAHTPDCLDIIPFFAHLAAQLFHMGIDGSGITEIIIIPYMIQNFLTG